MHACTKEGFEYALILGQTVYTLEGDEKNLAKYAGKCNKAPAAGSISESKRRPGIETAALILSPTLLGE